MQTRSRAAKASTQKAPAPVQKEKTDANGKGNGAAQRATLKKLDAQSGSTKKAGGATQIWADDQLNRAQNMNNSGGKASNSRVDRSISQNNQINQISKASKGIQKVPVGSSNSAASHSKANHNAKKGKHVSAGQKASQAAPQQQVTKQIGDDGADSDHLRIPLTIATKNKTQDVLAEQIQGLNEQLNKNREAQKNVMASDGCIEISGGKATSQKKQSSAKSDNKLIMGQADQSKLFHDGQTQFQRQKPKNSASKKEAYAGKGTPAVYMSTEYSKEMVHFSIMKKYDPKLTADQQMGAQNGGESHLTRATLNLIIRESLPSSVRAQKDTIELICYLANSFVDLLSDISNNVCTDQKKKVIIPEHTLRALQELHLDEYLPFVLLDNQLSDTPDRDVPFLNPKKVTHEQREDVIVQLLKRLETAKEFSDPSRKNKVRVELTQQDIENQNKLLGNLNQDSEYYEEMPPNDQQEFYNEEQYQYSISDANQLGGGVNDEHGNNFPMDSEGQQAVGMEGHHSHAHASQDQLVAQHRNNWIEHNKGLLEQEYESWVASCIDYNIEQARIYHEQNGAQAQQAASDQFLTTDQSFRNVYPPAYFFDMQYNQYGAQQFDEQQEQQQQQDAAASLDTRAANVPEGTEDAKQVQEIEEAEGIKDQRDDCDIDFDNLE